MRALVLRKLTVYVSLALLLFGNLAPAAVGAVTATAGVAKRCPAGKSAKKIKQRVKVTVRSRSRGKVKHKRVWKTKRV